MQEMTIKVPAPFAGISDLGFTTQYPRAEPFKEPRDVPLLIEGPASALRRLADRLRLLREGSAAGHTWSDPIMLSDEVVVMAFRDRSLEGRVLSDGARASHDYVFNLVRPVAFPFLQDCAQIADLRLSERIEMRVSTRDQTIELAVRLDQIVEQNGKVLLINVL